MRTLKTRPAGVLVLLLEFWQLRPPGTAAAVDGSPTLMAWVMAATVEALPTTMLAREGKAVLASILVAPPGAALAVVRSTRTARGTPKARSIELAVVVILLRAVLRG